jgi:NADH-quinone oxidoreductase subunit J
MNFQLISFYVFAAILILSALGVITARNPVHAVLLLVLAFVTAAMTWMLVYAEFLALTLILVYVGAVMVLFLFVVMMLDINFDKLREGFWKHLPLAGAIGFLMALEMVLVLASRAIPTSSLPPAAGVSNTKELGRLMFTEYVFTFELAAVLLLVAMVAAIALTLRTRKEVKSQDPAEQVAVKRNDRLKIIKMDASTSKPATEPPSAPAPGAD